MDAEMIVGTGFAFDDRKSEKKALVREAAMLVDNGAKVTDASIEIYDRYHRASWRLADEKTLDRNLASIRHAVRLYRASRPKRTT